MDRDRHKSMTLGPKDSTNGHSLIKVVSGESRRLCLVDIICQSWWDGCAHCGCFERDLASTRCALQNPGSWDGSAKRWPGLWIALFACGALSVGLASNGSLHLSAKKEQRKKQEDFLRKEIRRGLLVVRLIFAFLAQIRPLLRVVTPRAKRILIRCPLFKRSKKICQRKESSKGSSQLAQQSPTRSR